MTYEEAADYAGVTISTIYKAVQNHELKATRVYLDPNRSQPGLENYILIHPGDVDRWLSRRLKEHKRPQRLVTFVHQDEYDKFVTYCAKRGEKCSWVIRELICKELHSHGYKLQRYSKEDQK